MKRKFCVRFGRRTSIESSLKCNFTTTDSLKLSGINLNGCSPPRHHKTWMEDLDKSIVLPMLPYPKYPSLNSTLLSSDITTQVIPGASSADLLRHHGFISGRTALEIAQEGNERLARKMDAARILDEINRYDQAILGYYAPKVPSFQILKRSYDNQAFHFSDGRKLSYESM